MPKAIHQLFTFLLMANNAVIDENVDNNEDNIEDVNNDEVDEHSDNNIGENGDQLGNQISTYIGTDTEKWKLMIGTINTLHVNLYPKIFKKHSSNQNWIGVHDDFPNIEFDRQALDDAIEAMNFIKKDFT